MVMSSLEVGRFYKSRGGKTVQIIRKGWGFAPFEGDNGTEYFADGRTDMFSIEMDDLMSEIQAPTSEDQLVEVIGALLVDGVVGIVKGVSFLVRKASKIK